MTARGGRGRREPARRAGGKNTSARKPTGARRPTPAAGPTVPAPAAPAGPFRLGAIPGAAPGKWIDAWHQRMPRSPLELIPLEVRDQERALTDGTVDAALVRLPLASEAAAALHVISLYDEVAVVVCAADSALTAVDELQPADLAGEVLIVPEDDVLGVRMPQTSAPAFAPPPSTADAIEIVATGVGIVIVPMSLARLHHRKDVAHRPLVDGPVSTVALAWPADATTPAVETFVGIVRGRTANSSR
jgi:hypothetical protein